MEHVLTQGNFSGGSTYNVILPFIVRYLLRNKLHLFYNDYFNMVPRRLKQHKVRCMFELNMILWVRLKAPLETNIDENRNMFLSRCALYICNVTNILFSQCAKKFTLVILVNLLNSPQTIYTDVNKIAKISFE